MSSTRPAARPRTAPPPEEGPGGNHSSVVLGPQDRLVGQLHIEGDLRVVGTVEGELDVTGTVEIDDGGRVTGPVTARDKLVVGRAGSLNGDVRVRRLVIEDGATFTGNVSMGKIAEVSPKPPEAPALSETASEPEPVKRSEPKSRRR